MGKAFIAAGAAVALVLGLILVIGVGLGGQPASAACGSTTLGGGATTVDTTQLPTVAGWNQTQVSNAAAIIAAGIGAKIDAHGQQIAVMVAMDESSLTVVDHGDSAGPDSRGLFQQRNSWGPLSVRMDPQGSARLFYAALVKIPGWETMTPTLAAHAVQRNLDPYVYAPFWPKAQALYDAIIHTSALDGALGVTITDPAPDCGGTFSTNAAAGYVGPFTPAQLQERMAAIIAKNDSANVDPFFATQPDGSWHDNCQQFVSILDGKAHSGYNTAAIAWSGFVKAGTAHPAGGPDGLAPPIGAWLYYSPNHVALYLGNNQVASTDVWGDGTANIGPASDITGGRWHLTYLGWAAPWGAKVTTTTQPGPGPAIGTGIVAGGRGTGFVTATLNVLGASHTAAGGDVAGRTDSGPRTRAMVSFLSSYAPDVVGFQEFQSPQAALFDKLAGKSYARYPTKRGVSPENTVAWRRDRFSLVSASMIAIPYFGGSTKKIPWVVLRQIATGKQVVVSTVHNPASGCAVCGGNNDQWRRRAVNKEVKIIGQLKAQGASVLFMGDMNEKKPAFCAFTAGGLMSAASGGSNSPSGCKPPKGIPIDQIFGVGISWSGYKVDNTSRAFTDHGYVTAGVQLAAGSR